MNFLNWLRPGLKIKRWVLIGILGIVFVVIGMHPFLQFLLGQKFLLDYYLGILFLGIFCIVLGVNRGMIALLNLLDIPHAETGYRGRFDKAIYQRKILMKGPKVVVIGGGTGLSVLLRGIKKFTSNITAIVTVADDGGGSGILREDLGMLPPGDIRNCILALANTEPIMEKLLQYRFEEGSLKGQSFGNLLIAAMNGISDNFEEAIKKLNDVVAVTGKVLPVTTENITLYAKLKNGKVIKGESQIPEKAREFESEIEHVFIKPEGARPVGEAIEAIQQADVVILGPGSLYTSVIPNLLVQEISQAIKKSTAMKVYVTNVMTQPGETDGYGVCQHLEAITRHMKEPVVDYVFVNNEEIPEIVLSKYAKDGAIPVKLTKEDKEKIEKQGITVKEGPFVDVRKQYIRHDAEQLSQCIMNLVLEEKYATDKVRILDYYHIHEKMKALQKD